MTRTIFDGCYLWSLFSSYDQHHMLEYDEETTIGVREKINTRLLREHIKIQMWIVLFQRLKNLCMMSQLYCEHMHMLLYQLELTLSL